MIKIDSWPPQPGNVRLTDEAELAIRTARFAENGNRSRIISTIGEQAMSTLLAATGASIETGTYDAGVIALSLWENHPVLSHQPDHGAFIAGLDDARAKFHKVLDFADVQGVNHV